ncbi:3453_t:CDS:2 [Funneliformis geosporum]|uniref:3453_t:CDS:1 n=1 Tax=Funneliformis geosporum TaxID=1117311 RepID=A0A9W4SYU4_9GLOM|nr:3453_t:CDS:2 [Funneliformis geosporum]
MSDSQGRLEVLPYYHLVLRDAHTSRFGLHLPFLRTGKVNYGHIHFSTPLKAGSFFSRYKDFTIDGPQNIAIRISASYYFGTKRKVNYLEVREGKKPKPDSASTSVEKAFETEEQQGKQPEIRNHEELKKAPEEKSEEEIYNDDIIPFAISDDVENGTIHVFIQTPGLQSKEAKFQTLIMPGTIIVNHLLKDFSLSLRLPKRIDEQSKVKVEVLFRVTQIIFKIKTYTSHPLMIE